VTAALYLLYAFVQAVLFVRFIIEEEDDPVPAVVMAFLFAPLVTVSLLIALAWCITHWLAGGR
jgi:hypothetical protein